MRTSRVRSGAVGALLGLVVTSLCLATGPVAHADGDEPAPTEPAAAEPAPLTIATFNTEAGLKPGKAIHDVRQLAAHGPDVITLQEFANPTKKRRVRETLADCDACVYDVFYPQPATPGSTPILYNSERLRLISQETVQVTKATYVGKRGAGPSTIRPKFVNWVQLRDLQTGRPVNILNNHAVPSVQGKSGGPNRHNKARLNIYRKHMKGLVALIRAIRQQSKGLVVVTGDLNVNFRRDRILRPHVFPYYNMHLVRLRASYEYLGMPRMGTHVLHNGNGTRLIDYAYIEKRRYATPVSQEILTGFNSDHRPLMVGIDLKPFAGWTPPTADPVDQPAP